MSEGFLAQPEVKKAFDNYNTRERIRLAKVACWVCAVAMPSAVFLDVIDYPQYAGYFFELRLTCSFMALMVLGFFYTAWGERHHLLLTLILAIMSQGFVAWMIYSSEGAVSPYYAILNLPLLIYCLLFPWTYLMTIGLSAATIFFYLIACFAHGGVTTGHIFFSNLIFLLYTVSFAVIASYFTNQLRIREFTTRYELDQSRRQLAESNQKLIELDQAKSQFFANISHELRTPLTLLIAPLAELQRQDSFDQPTREIFNLMQGNAMRLLKLINDLLELAKLESGRMEVRKEPLAITEFVRGLTQSVQAAAKDKRVQLFSRVPKELGTVMVDRDKLEKIILNLLFNSVKFTPAGGEIDFSVAAQDPFLILKVRDTGMGISGKNLPFIFDRFWQADGTAQRKYQGTGIGLALVKEMVEAQGGKVIVESQLGIGTTMTVQLPLEPVVQVAGMEGFPASEGIPKASPESEEWLTKLYRRAELFPAMTPLSETLRTDDYRKSKGPRILIADDEPDMLAFLKSQMEKHYEILEAVDGNQAVEKARQFLPDLILLDMMMPEKDGIQACRELKEQVSTQSIPIILLTARADEDTKFSALNAGASDFLTKPFSTTELHVRVKNLVESYQLQRDLARQKSALESTLEQLKETEGQLVQNEKMASLGRLSAGIIHEINNPLNYATSALHLLKMKKDRIPEEERAKYVETVADIEEGVGRVQRIVSDLRTFSHPKSGGGEDLLELEEAVSTALRFLSHELKGKIKVDLKIPKDQQVLADRNKLIHVFVNLFQNAVDALNEKKFSSEEPLLTIQSREAEGKVLVSIRDNGAGIAPGNLDKIFDPFFTTKDVGRGMGLGLSLSYRLLSDQGGNITVKSEQGSFTEFNLEMPTKK